MRFDRVPGIGRLSTACKFRASKGYRSSSSSRSISISSGADSATSGRSTAGNGGLSHVDDSGNPCMVDVSAKAVTTRSATATARIILPPFVFALLERREDGRGVEIIGAKGAVFSTAVIAGTIGAKSTSSLIPFCHPLPVEHVHIGVSVDEKAERTVRVECTVRTTGKTGVEMEALTGASVASLCIYDMLKALSHDIVIADVQLEQKTGGKSDIGAMAHTRN